MHQGASLQREGSPIRFNHRLSRLIVLLFHEGRAGGAPVTSNPRRRGPYGLGAWGRSRANDMLRASKRRCFCWIRMKTYEPPPSPFRKFRPESAATPREFKPTQTNKKHQVPRRSASVRKIEAQADTKVP